MIESDGLEEKKLINSCNWTTDIGNKLWGDVNVDWDGKKWGLVKFLSILLINFLFFLSRWVQKWLNFELKVVCRKLNQHLSLSLTIKSVTQFFRWEMCHNKTEKLITLIQPTKSLNLRPRDITKERCAWNKISNSQVSKFHVLCNAKTHKVRIDIHN